MVLKSFLCSIPPLWLRPPACDPLHSLDQLLSAQNFPLLPHDSPAVVPLFGPSYVAHVTIGSQTVPLLIDTGSSALWVAPHDFQCLDADGLEVDQSTCGFPGFYEGGDFSLVAEEYFSDLYGNGQYAFGPGGIAAVSMGGVTVPDAFVGLPSRGYIHVATGDFMGILGLAYPPMVPIRKGPVPRVLMDNDDPHGEQDSWFFGAIKKNLTQPLFSMALDIDGGGLLGIGGVVDVPVLGDFVSSPILKVTFHGKLRWWAITDKRRTPDRPAQRNPCQRQAHLLHHPSRRLHRQQPTLLRASRRHKHSCNEWVSRRHRQRLLRQRPAALARGALLRRLS